MILSPKGRGWVKTHSKCRRKNREPLNKINTLKAHWGGYFANKKAQAAIRMRRVN